MATRISKKGSLLRPQRVDGCPRFCIVHEVGARNRRLYVWVYTEKGKEPDALFKVLPETIHLVYPDRLLLGTGFSAVWTEADPRALLVGVQWEEISPERWGSETLQTVVLEARRPIGAQAEVAN